MDQTQNGRITKVPFKPCMSVSGSSGKTTWVYRLLKHLPGMYVEQHIVSCRPTNTILLWSQ
jgi:GTPase SAR1 family protein